MFTRSMLLERCHYPRDRKSAMGIKGIVVPCGDDYGGDENDDDDDCLEAHQKTKKQKKKIIMGSNALYAG